MHGCREGRKPEASPDFPVAVKDRR